MPYLTHDERNEGQAPDVTVQRNLHEIPHASDCNAWVDEPCDCYVRRINAE